MPTGPAARVTDLTAHGSPLAPGPGSMNVFIGFLPAWRGIPLAAAGALQAAQTAADIAVKTAETATKAAAGTPGAPAALAAEQATKASLLASMSSMMSSFAGMSDIHVCPIPTPVPPHGPGVVIDGCATVLINNMPACVVGCTVLEALGGPDKIVKGEMTVIIGDSAGGGGGGAPGAGGAAAAAAGAGAAGAAAGGVGKPSNGPFDSVDDAARAALNNANPQSIKDNLEYSGLIYQGKDGKYYYTGPAKGTDQGANPLRDAPAPPGTKVVGDYHTHADYSTVDPVTGKAVRTSDPARDDFDSDNFSDTDKKDSDKQGYPGYLGTPGGTFRKYDPATKTDTTI